jgi:hypothetical protein
MFNNKERDKMTKEEKEHYAHWKANHAIGTVYKKPMINTAATQKNIKDIVKAIGTITNTMSKVILNNRKEIESLKARVKELENNEETLAQWMRK